MRNFLFLNFFFVNFVAASDIGINPSTNKEVILGINTITAAMCTPKSIIWPTLYPARAPTRTPNINPSIVGCPNTPKYFSALSISKLISLSPGILSMSQLRG